jgi:hypothetical protein
MDPVESLFDIEPLKSHPDQLSDVYEKTTSSDLGCGGVKEGRFGMLGKLGGRCDAIG